MAEKNTEIAYIKGELEIVQKALKLQTKRCRQLVAEYTKRLQQKEHQYHCEKTLREDQLAKVLRALLIFEARLRQEQKFISHQLQDKDGIIKKQNNHIKKLMSSQLCKNCNQYYSPSPTLESLDSSSEYVATDYHDYQSSNFESLDSSSEIYATLSEKSFNTGKSYDNSYSGEDGSKTESDSNRNIYQKNVKWTSSLGRRNKKIPHRKSVGTYFEVLKLRNDSPYSNEDNTSNDYDNLDSLPPESLTDKISTVSERIENIFQQGHENSSESISSSVNLSLSECHTTVINQGQNFTGNDSTNIEATLKDDNKLKNNYLNENNPNAEKNERKLSDSITVFEADGESNDKWYASASDQEDEEHRDVYRDNPVLECVNQILLQNMNDNLSSPPKTPATERKSTKNKRVKFSDEEDNKLAESALTQENVKENLLETESQGYYETPIQKTPNFYETPQSIYSNDYEQILSRCSDSFSGTPPNKVENKQEKEINSMSSRKLSVPKNAFDSPDKPNHVYIDMDTKSDTDERDIKIVRKSKILRAPPALPPKPANLTSKHKISNLSVTLTRQKSSEHLESEPDYCSISELNLPTNKTVSMRKISVVAEIHPLDSKDVKNKLEKASTKTKPEDFNSDYDLVIVNDNIPNVLVKKHVEKFNIQTAKQTYIKDDCAIKIPATNNKEPEIPKLPQVSEIIIPEENEEHKEEKKEERINIDNYVKNNTQVFKLKNNHSERRSIKMGSSVSSLISGFNKQPLSNDIIRKPERKLDKTMFSSFESVQNLEKHSSPKIEKINEPEPFEEFDLSQNFEEFKLDDCEIEEYNVEMCDITEEEIQNDIKIVEAKLASVEKSPANIERTPIKTNNMVEMIRATNDVMMPNLSRHSVELLKKQLQLQKKNLPHEQLFRENSPRKHNEPTYEHFLECTGLSSKSILTPSRLLSNHKNMLKPKDVKLRSKVKANNLMERHSLSGVSTKKYWSEPYV